MPPITVVIAGQAQTDRATYRESMGALADIRVVGEATTLTETLEALKLRPRVLVLDLPRRRGVHRA
jgi:hypothetical protein